MKNHKIISCLLGLLFLLICNSEIKAQNGCDNCLAANNNSFFCVKTIQDSENRTRTFIYERAACEEFRFVGMNVRAFARMADDDYELNNILLAAADMGATVIRFFATNYNLTDDVAVNKVRQVLDKVRNHDDYRVKNMKFIITLVDFYRGGEYYWADNADYYPRGNDATANPKPYIDRNGLKVIQDKWFRLDTPAEPNHLSYELAYKPWVERLVGGLSGEQYQQQILAFELGNELQNFSAKRDNDQGNFDEMIYVRDFVNDIISTIKFITPKVLVTLGAASTDHTLAGTTASGHLLVFREDVYKQAGDTRDDMLDKADFMTIHNYNNEWTEYSEWPNEGVFHRQQDDITYATENDIPWVVEEFGYSGNASSFLHEGGTTAEFFPGIAPYTVNGNERKRWTNCWEDIPTDGTSITIPGIETSSDIGSQKRACATQTGISIYHDAGANGVMAWGFNPIPWDGQPRHIGGNTTELDIRYAADYNYLEAAWAHGSYLFNPPYLYECSVGAMNLVGDTDDFKYLDCQGPTINTTQTLASGISMKYGASDSISFSITAAGVGFEALPGTVLEAEIKVVDCLTCADPVPCAGLKLSESQEDDQYQFTIQPNPFTAQTEIVFNLTEDAPVTIHITDMMGRHVTTLADGETKTTGQHTVIFDGSQYPSGMYMTHIQVGEYSGTQKMILAK